MQKNRSERSRAGQLNNLVAAPQGVTELEEIIRAEIRAAGAIPFARFMELALYHPAHGYYSKNRKQTGREGDFYTSVSVGSLYGEFLGFEFARRLEPVSGSDLLLIEAGAHDGQLAVDLLSYLQNYQQDLLRRIEYVILEPSPALAERQARTLAGFRGKVRWAEDWSEIKAFRGVCFSNELFDAMPVNVFRWSAQEKRWHEWGVGEADVRFEWRPLPDAPGANARGRERPREPFPPALPSELLNVLPDGFTTEVCPAAASWWRQAANALQEGCLYTADYGLAQEEFFTPQRAHGTLRAYSRHSSHRNVLEAPGTQDLTAHVNFSQLIAAGESAGLKTGAFERQGVFLTGVLERIERTPAAFPLWTPMRYRQLASLVHPEHLGRSFKILTQSR